MDLTALEQNPLVSGGLILMLAGGVFFYLKQLPGRCYDFLERFFFLKIEILDSDEAYQWMQVWLAERLRTTLSVSVLTRRGPVDPEAEDAEPTSRPSIHFV